MSSVQHLSIIVTGWNKEVLNKAREVAINLFTEELVTENVKSLINEYESFMVCSSGSKAGWDEGIQHQKDVIKFTMFLDTMRSGKERHDSSLQYVVVAYGDCGAIIQDTNQINKFVKKDCFVEKFREDDLFCPKCHCPQEGTDKITETAGDYKCEICGEVFHYSYNKLNAQWSSFEEK